MDRRLRIPLRLRLRRLAIPTHRPASRVEQPLALTPAGMGAPIQLRSTLASAETGHYNSTLFLPKSICLPFATISGRSPTARRRRISWRS
jgi:hypothetical protein